VISDVMHVPMDVVQPDAILERLGETDSLTMAEIASALEAEFGIRIRTEALGEARTAIEFTAIVQSAVSAEA